MKAKHLIKRRILSMLMISMMFIVTACNNNTKDSSKTIFTVNNYNVSLNEYTNYMIQLLSCYHVESAEMTDDVKEGFYKDTTDDIRMNIIIESMAKENNIELTEEEYNEHVVTNADMFMTYYADNIVKDYNIDKALVEKYFERKALTQKYEAFVEKNFFDEYKNQLMGELTVDKFCSFDIISFETAESATAFKDSITDSTSYDEILEKLAKVSDYTMTTDRGIYGGFDEAINVAINGLKDGKLSKVINYQGKSTIILMQKSADEEFYNQTITYIASESAKSSFIDEVNKYIQEKNIPEITLDDATKELVDPEKIYAELCSVEGKSN